MTMLLRKAGDLRVRSRSGRPGSGRGPAFTRVHRSSYPRSWGRLSIVAIEVGAIALVLVLWQLSGRFLNPLFISTPTAVASHFWHLTLQGTIPQAFWYSALQMLVGFFIASALGIGLGVVIRSIPLLGRAAEPLVYFANASPGVAILPVLIIWFGLGNTARVAFIALLGLWTMTINTLVGVENVDSTFRDVGRAFRLGWLATMWKILMPGSMPYVLAGARIAMAQCAVGMILAGQEVGYSGLGGLADTYSGESNTAALVAAILTSTGLALLLFGCLRLTQRVFFSWIAENSGRQEAGRGQ